MDLNAGNLLLDHNVGSVWEEHVEASLGLDYVNVIFCFYLHVHSQKFPHNSASIALLSCAVVPTSMHLHGFF